MTKSKAPSSKSDRPASRSFWITFTPLAMHDTMSRSLISTP